MFHIELNQLEEAQDYLEELFELVEKTVSSNNDLADDDKIRYKIIAKYRQGQIWYKKALANENSKIKLMNQAELKFREAIEYAAEIRWMRSTIALKTRLAELLIEHNTNNNLTEAAKLLQSASSATEANKYRRRSAYCLFAWARLYDKKNQKEEAVQNAQAALNIFKEFGMEKRQKAVEDFLEQLNKNQ